MLTRLKIDNTRNRVRTAIPPANEDDLHLARTLARRLAFGFRIGPAKLVAISATRSAEDLICGISEGQIDCLQENRLRFHSISRYLGTRCFIKGSTVLQNLLFPGMYFS